MKKIISLLLILLLTASLVVACGGKSLDLDVAAFAEKVKSEIDFLDPLNPMRDNLLAQIYGLEEAQIKQKAILVSTGATPEEVAVFEGVDQKAADAIEKALHERIAYQRLAFENYIPAEMPKLADPPVLRAGNYVVLVISGDDAGVKDLVANFFKGEK